MASSGALRTTARVAAGTLLAGSAVTAFAGVATASPGWGGGHYARANAATTSSTHGPSTSAKHYPVTICHRTDSDKNPYVVITVDADATDGGLADKGRGDHTTHTGPIWNDALKDSHTKWGDIIPPYDFPGGHFNGYNWTAQGQSIYDAGCAVVAPTPSQSSSASVSPSTSVSASESSTASASASASVSGSASGSSSASASTSASASSSTSATASVEATSATVTPTESEQSGGATATPQTVVEGVKVVRHPAKHAHQPTPSTPVVRGEQATRLPYTGSNSGRLLGLSLIMLGGGALLLLAGLRREA